MIFHCKNFYTVKRPTMSQIVHFLQCLHVFNGDFDVVEGFFIGVGLLYFSGEEKKLKMERMSQDRLSGYEG